MDVLKKYRVYCHTESNFVETWTFAKPDKCPNNQRHIIDENQTLLLEKKMIENNNVQRVFIDSKSYYDTNGYYMSEGKEYCIPIGSSNYISDFSLPVRMCIFGMKIYPQNNQIHDKFDIIINPETPIGFITQEVNIGSSNIPVNPTVIQYAVPGFYCLLNSNEYLIQKVNINENSVCLRETTTETYSPGTLFKLNVYIAKNYIIGNTNTLEIGYGTSGGKPFEENSVIRLLYKNFNPSEQKQFCLNYEYTY